VTIIERADKSFKRSKYSLAEEWAIPNCDNSSLLNHEDTIYFCFNGSWLKVPPNTFKEIIASADKFPLFHVRLQGKVLPEHREVEERYPYSQRLYSLPEINVDIFLSGLHELYRSLATEKIHLNTQSESDKNETISFGLDPLPSPSKKPPKDRPHQRVATDARDSLIRRIGEEILENHEESTDFSKKMTKRRLNTLIHSKVKIDRRFESTHLTTDIIRKALVPLVLK
jgi:hypothetical protein